MLLAGCAVRPVSQAPAPVTVQLAEAAPGIERREATGADPGGVVLVWGSPDDGAPRTWHVAEDGSVLREEPGIVVATRQGPWRLELREEPVETTGCELWDGTLGEPGEGTATRAELVLRGGSARQEVIAPPAGDAFQEIGHAVEVLGSVGPYLFLHESTYTYACGAHGFTEASFTVWDAERRERVDLISAVPGVSALKNAAEKILNEQDDDAAAAALDGESPELVQIMPSYGRQGWLRLSAQLARAACYACSDGTWTSYSRSATVPTAWVPARLAPWAAPPSGVRVFLSHHPRVKMGGWSRAGHEE